MDLERLIQINLLSATPVFIMSDCKHHKSNSIREKGIVQPIIVREIDSAGSYEVIAGERRWRAAQIAQLDNIPAIIKTLSDDDALEIAIIENVQRSNLSPVDEAAGYQRLIDIYNYTQEDLAQVIGKSRSYITNSLRLLTLPEEVLKLIESKKAGWRNSKHIKQWSQSLKSYAAPLLDSKPLNTVTTRDILSILQPIWATKHETARRVQQRLKKVFGYAKTMGWYDHPNPAVWEDNLEHLLAPTRQVKRMFHHPSLQWMELPYFYKKLMAIDTTASKALQLLILTACRTHEILSLIHI